jgi:hypothetical protein
LSVVLYHARNGRYPPGARIVRLRDGALLACVMRAGMPMRVERRPLIASIDPDHLVVPPEFDDGAVK